MVYELHSAGRLPPVAAAGCRQWNAFLYVTGALPAAAGCWMGWSGAAVAPSEAESSAQSLQAFQPAATELTVAAPRGAIAAFQQLRGACSHGRAGGTCKSVREWGLASKMGAADERQG